MTTLLPASLQNSLQEIVERANQRAASIRGILLSTTEGVPLGRVIADQSLPGDVLASIESVWAPASKQFPVLGLEKVKQVTAIYDHGTLVHIYQPPMVSLKLDGMKFTFWLLYSHCIVTFANLISNLRMIHLVLLQSLPIR